MGYDNEVEEEGWELFFGSLDDYESEECKISGLAVINAQEKVVYSSGWLRQELVSSSQDIKGITRALSGSEKQTIELKQKRFCIFHRTTRTVCGISKGRQRGLILHRFSGIIVIASFHWPLTIDRVFPYFIGFFK